MHYIIKNGERIYGNYKGAKLYDCIGNEIPIVGPIYDIDLEIEDLNTEIRNISEKIQNLRGISANFQKQSAKYWINKFKSLDVCPNWAVSQSVWSEEAKNLMLRIPYMLDVSFSHEGKIKFKLWDQDFEIKKDGQISVNGIAGH